MATVADGAVSEGTFTYDLGIVSTEDAPSLVASTPAGTLPLASIGPAADIVS